MGSAAKESVGTFRFSIASTFNFADCLRRGAFGLLPAAFGMRGVLALVAWMVAACAVPAAAQQVQFFGSFQPYSQNGASYAQGLVTDAGGNLYVSGAHALVYIPVDANGVPTSNGSNVSCSPGSGAVMGLAIDTTNHILFRADLSGPNSQPDVEEFALTGGSSTNCNLSYIDNGSWSAPSSVAVDASSNLYVLDAGTGGGTTGTIYELTPGSGYSKSEVCSSTDLRNTTGLSIDGSGNFYVASSSDSAAAGFTYNYGLESPGLASATGVFKVTGAGGGTCTLTQIDSGLTSPTATAADAAGNIWVADLGANRICLLMPNGSDGYNQSSFQSISQIRTLTVNSAGKLYGFAYQDAGAQKALVWTGGTSPHYLGTYNIGTAAPTVTVTVDFMDPATADGFNVTTQGSSTGDFQATGGTCAPGSYSALQSCTVQVRFTPQAPGLRTGALVVTDNNGNLLGTNYLYGTGAGPQVGFASSVPSTLASGNFTAPDGVVVDGNGNIFVADSSSNTVKEIVAAGGYTAVNTLAQANGNFSSPAGLAIDGAANIFVADPGNNAVKEIVAAGGYTIVNTLGSGFTLPYGVAVDGSGNVFVADSESTHVNEILAAGGYITVNQLGGDLCGPAGVAVDSSDNVFVADENDCSGVYELTAASNYATVNQLSGDFTLPRGLAVDGAGNVFVANTGGGNVIEILASGGYTIADTLAAATGPYGVAVDSSGNVFVGSKGDGTVKKLDRADPPSLSFATATPAGSTDTTDGTKTVTVENFGNAALTFSAVSYPADFSEAAGVETDCATSTPVAAGGSCTLSVESAPVGWGTHSESLELTDNAPRTPQIISLSGTTTTPTITLSPTSETLTAGTVGIAYSQTFSGGGGTSPYTYAITINSGTLPNGLSFSGGVLSGTPLASGTVTFSIVATDSTLSPGPYSSSSQSYSLTVNAPPVVISVSPASLPDGAIGVPYSRSIAASGGSGSYSYAVTAGSLPSWLSLNSSTGALSGTPTSAGALSFTITATDTINEVSSYQAYTPTIWAAASTATAQNAGSSNIGSPASTTTLTFTFNIAATLGSINVVTEGAPNLDFINAGSGTCAAGAYSATNTCTVDVTFTPQSAGTRDGAVLLEDASGAVLGTGYVYGTGVGPQVTFPPGTVSTLAQAYTSASGFNSTFGVAVDGNGNIFVVDNGNNAVKEILAAGGYTTVNTLAQANGNFWNPYGVAVDGAGNVFVGDSNNNAVKKILAAGGYTTVITLAQANGNFHSPLGVAVDGSGNVFVADTTNDVIKEIVAAGGYATVDTLAQANGNFNAPYTLAVDGSGNVFVGDTMNNAVKEILAAGGYTTVNTLAPAYAAANGFIGPNGIAVDGNGNVFVAGYNNAVKEIVAAGGYTTVNTLGTFSWPHGVAVDGSGNVFVADTLNNAVRKIDYADAPALTFATTTGVGSADSTDNPLTVTLLNNGSAALSLTVPGTGTNPAIVDGSFTLDGSSSCAQVSAGGTEGSLAPGASCTYAVDFTPQASGANPGSLTVYDNNLNNASASQQITLLGTAMAIAPASGALSAGTVGMAYSQAFSATGGSGSYAYSSSGTLPNGLSLSASGVLAGTPTLAGGPWSFSVMATDTNSGSSVSQAYTLSIAQGTATITLGSLSQTYTGSPLTATAMTTPASLNVSFTYDGSSTAPTAAGSYAVVGTINDTDYTGSATGTLVVSKAAATVTLGSLSQTYTGSPLTATATTNPTSLNVSFTYNGSSTAPTAAGSYAVVGTIDDANYTGTALGTMVIAKAAATVTLGSLGQTYTGSPLTATAMTTPASLNVSFTYNGSSTAPTAAGSYAVVGTINDTDYTGSATRTLVVSAAASSVSLMPSANPAVLMNSVTLTATVSSIAGTPSGQVTFLDGTTPLGSVALSSGVGALTTSALTAGVHSITATYATTGDFSGSSSSALSMTVVDLSVGSGGGSGGTGSSQTSTPGGSASYTLNLTPTVGTTFPSPITLTVTGLPSGATATLDTGGWTQEAPTSWILAANQPVSNVSLVFQLPAQTAAAAPNNGPARDIPLVALGILLLPFARKWRSAGKRMSRRLCLLLIAAGIAAVTGATGCGGSSSYSQTYNVTVTVTAGTLTHSTQLTLIVK